MGVEEWACTLPTDQRPLRVAEFEEVFAGSVLAADRPQPGRLRLRLRPAAEVAARVASLAAREVECCSFFTFTLTAAAGELSLEVTVPAEHVGVLDALTARVAPERTSPE